MNPYYPYYTPGMVLLPGQGQQTNLGGPPHPQPQPYSLAPQGQFAQPTVNGAVASPQVHINNIFPHQPPPTHYHGGMMQQQPPSWPTSGTAVPSVPAGYMGPEHQQGRAPTPASGVYPTMERQHWQAPISSQAAQLPQQMMGMRAPSSQTGCSSHQRGKRPASALDEAMGSPPGLCNGRYDAHTSGNGPRVPKKTYMRKSSVNSLEQKQKRHAAAAPQAQTQASVQSHAQALYQGQAQHQSEPQAQLQAQVGAHPQPTVKPESRAETPPAPVWEPGTLRPDGLRHPPPKLTVPPGYPIADPWILERQQELRDRDIESVQATNRRRALRHNSARLEVAEDSVRKARAREQGYLPPLKQAELPSLGSKEEPLDVDSCESSDVREAATQSGPPWGSDFNSDGLDLDDIHIGLQLLEFRADAFPQTDSSEEPSSSTADNSETHNDKPEDNPGPDEGLQRHLAGLPRLPDVPVFSDRDFERLMHGEYKEKLPAYVKAGLFTERQLDVVCSRMMCRRVFEATVRKRWAREGGVGGGDVVYVDDGVDDDDGDGDGDDDGGGGGGGGGGGRRRRRRYRRVGGKA